MSDVAGNAKSELLSPALLVHRRVAEHSFARVIMQPSKGGLVKYLEPHVVLSSGDVANRVASSAEKSAGKIRSLTTPAASSGEQDGDSIVARKACVTGA